jgi:plastocyanin
MKMCGGNGRGTHEALGRDLHAMCGLQRRGGLAWLVICITVRSALGPSRSEPVSPEVRMRTHHKLTRRCWVVLLLCASAACTDSAAKGSDGGDARGSKGGDAAANDPRTGGKKPMRDAGTTPSGKSDAAVDVDANVKVDMDAATKTAECSAAKPCASPADLGECQLAACVDGMCEVESAALSKACTENGGKVCDGDGACVECVADAKCASKVCQDGTCRPAVCGNGTLDTGETDIDCGGDCGGCGPNQACLIDADCAGMECTSLSCVPNCADGVKNGSESAKDCGASCGDAAKLCANSLACGNDADCDSGFCNSTSMQCATPSCSDGIKNGTETAKDCGGTCPACPTPCTDNWECDAVIGAGKGLCYDGFCTETVNGCSIESATDRTGMVAASLTTPIEIAFGGTTGLKYSPNCIKVTMGTKIKFVGTFSSHPLVGGKVVGGVKQPASTGPFTTITNTDTSKEFLMDDCAAYPYYCNVHGGGGMNGAVIVLLP